MGALDPVAAPQDDQTTAGQPRLPPPRSRGLDGCLPAASPDDAQGLLQTGIYHRLRIAIKRFRYIVENFLPLQHAAWSDDLKQVQDLLGEVHDLDVWEL